MSLLLFLACLWVVAGSLVAFLPMRSQYLPGLVLLLAAPVLIGALWWHVGAWIALAATAGVISMFRHPLRYLARRALGRPATPPARAPSPAAPSPSARDDATKAR